MSETTINHFDAGLSDAQKAVEAALVAQGGEWSGPQDYANFRLGRTLGKLDQVRNAIEQENPDADISEVNDAYQKSVNFAQQAFRNLYTTDTEVLGRKIDWAFAVPLRADRVSSEFASDTNPFFPLLNKKFGISPNIQTRGTIGVPPARIDEYKDGALIFTPFFATMLDDLSRHEQMAAGASIINATSLLVHKRIGATIMGLGATIPKLTMFGELFKVIPDEDMSEFKTTTGHAGTVHLILDTVKMLSERDAFADVHEIGMIGGAGSIGWSSTISALASSKEKSGLDIRKVHACDYRSELLHQKVAESEYREQIIPYAGDLIDTTRQVIESSEVIVVAVTKPVDLDVIDPFKQMSLEGKVFIDDSQPAQINRQQVEERGGRVIGVVGQDNSADFAATRRGIYTEGVPYNYGDDAGLVGERALWGCEAEVYSINRSGEFGAVITAEVTPEDVGPMGARMKSAGVVVNEIPQSFGARVDLP